MIKPLTGSDLLVAKIPERKSWMPPLICSGCLGMIFARPGIGKSYFCLWLAAALGGGMNFLKWVNYDMARVLYVDGEMGLRELQSRYRELDRAQRSECAKLHTTFLCPESFPGLVTPAINDPVGQRFYFGLMQQQDVLFLDNYSCLVRRGKSDTDEQLWSSIQPWLTQLRAMGKCVILVHHAGKSGDQLGTSTKEFALDWCLKFFVPADYEDDNGARFNVQFTKGRMKGEEKEAFTAWYKSVNGRTEWVWQGAKESRRGQMQKMKAIGMADRDIAQALGMSLFAVKKVLRDLEVEAMPQPPQWCEEERCDDLF